MRRLRKESEKSQVIFALDDMTHRSTNGLRSFLSDVLLLSLNAICMHYACKSGTYKVKLPLAVVQDVGPGDTVDLSYSLSVHRTRFPQVKDRRLPTSFFLTPSALPRHFFTSRMSTYHTSTLNAVYLNIHKFFTSNTIFFQKGLIIISKIKLNQYFPNLYYPSTK